MDLLGKSQSGLCPNGYDYSKSNTAKRFDLMRDALLVQDHPILYSLCEWGQANVQQWGKSPFRLNFPAQKADQILPSQAMQLARLGACLETLTQAGAASFNCSMKIPST